MGLVHEGWNSKSGRWASNAPAIEKRAREARVWLRELGVRAEKEGMQDVNIVVVTHGGFLHYFTDDVWFFFHLCYLTIDPLETEKLTFFQIVGRFLPLCRNRLD